jgi:nitrite reductase (NAD(P)H)
MGVDVASFGDFFADKRLFVKAQLATEVNDQKDRKSHLSAGASIEITVQDPPTNLPIQHRTPESPVVPKRRGAHKADEPIKCLVYNDPFSSTYKKYIFTADGKHLLGGMMIGDVSDFVKLVTIVKKKVQSPC